MFDCAILVYFRKVSIKHRYLGLAEKLEIDNPCQYYPRILRGCTYGILIHAIFIKIIAIKRGCGSFQGA